MFPTTSYLIASKLFVQFLGLIYAFAFSSFLPQMLGLFGKKGILPIGEFLTRVKFSLGKRRFYYIPSLFWLNSSDAFLLTVPIIGTLFSTLVFLQYWPALLLPILFILYLSIVSTGQDFLSFGWEGFLLEVTAHAILIALTPIPNGVVWLSINFLLFRFHLQAGAVKLQSRDPNWRNLTAVYEHYQSQPLPNTIAWYIHKFPLWFHKLSCLGMFGAELIVPFAVFGGEWLRLFAFFSLFSLQFFIWFTGNFSFLNHLSVTLLIILLSDRFLTPFFGPPELPAQIPLLLEIVVGLAGLSLLLLQVMRLWNSLAPVRIQLFDKILFAISPYHLANRYGIFAVMTTTRIEIVIEGSNDRENWKEYAFWFKPSETTRRSRRISPIQPRIDWQAWFLPFSYYESEPWFQKFLKRLLEGSPEVTQLLRVNPFPDKPPKYIRAIAYEYRFSDRETKKRTGQWWVREYVGKYSPIVNF